MSVPVFKNTANFGVRAMALAIDLVIIAAIYFFVLFLLAGRLVSEAVNLDSLVIIIIFCTLVVVLPVSFAFLHMVYFTLFHAYLGQTIGKMLMGIRVVNKDNMTVTPSVAFLRWAGYLLSFLPLAAGFFWSAVDRDHCAWHDRLARTWVVTAEMT